MINPFKEINWKPDRGELNKFAFSLIVGFPVIAVFFFLVKWITGGGMPEPRFFLLLGGIGAAVGIVCRALPLIGKFLYPLWYGLAACVGIVMANLLFTLLFYLLFAPLGFILKLTGRDPLHLKKQRDVASYWIDAPPTPPAKKYFRQF